MDTNKIKEIGDYLLELEHGLYEWDLNQIAMETEYPRLYETIKNLMDATFQAKEPETKTLLAYMEMRARKCMDCIRRRLSAKTN